MRKLLSSSFFRIVDNFLLAGLSRLHFKLQHEELIEKLCQKTWKMLKLFTFPIKKITIFSWAFFSSVGKTALYVSRGIWWADVVFEKILQICFLSDFQRKLIWQFKMLLSKHYFSYPDENFSWKLFSKGNFIDIRGLRSEIRRNFNEIFWASLSKLYLSVLKNFLIVMFFDRILTL